MSEQFLSLFVKGVITGVISFVTNRLLTRWFSDRSNK